MAATLPAPPPDASPADLLRSLALGETDEAHAAACAAILAARAAGDDCGPLITGGGLRALTSALRLHPDSADVCEHASHALWLMNFAPEGTAAATVALGAVPLLAQHWARHACHYTHLALEVLGYSDEGAWAGAEGLPALQEAAAAAEGEALAAAVRLYARAAGDASVAGAACAHLAALAFEGGGDEKCFSAGALPVLVGILAAHMASEEVAAQACHALRMLCYFPSGGSGYICSSAIALGAPRLLSQARQAYESAVYAAPALEALGCTEAGEWAEVPSAAATPPKRIAELLGMGKWAVPGLVEAAAAALGGLEGADQEEALRAGALPLLRGYLSLLDADEAAAAPLPAAVAGQALNAAGVPAALARRPSGPCGPANAYFCSRPCVVPGGSQDGACSSESGGEPCADCQALAPPPGGGAGEAAAAAAALRSAIAALSEHRPSVAAERARRAAAVARMEARALASPQGSGLRRDWDDFLAAQQEAARLSAAWVAEHGAGVPYRDGWSGTAEAVGEGWSEGEAAAWVPASALVPAPVLVDGGFAVADVGQGALGDCYLLAGLADLGEEEAGDTLDSVFVTGEPSECGLVCVRLWCDGAWKWVFLDSLFLSDSESDHNFCRYSGGGGREKIDGLPDPAAGKFFWQLTAHSTAQESELWPCYLEKAWAFIHGSFAGICGGRIAKSPCCAVQCSGFPLNFFLPDSLPGISEPLKASASDSEADAVWAKVTAWLAQGWLVTTGTRAEEGEASESRAEDGLLSNHMYSLLRCLDAPGQPRLLQLRNPHGHGEWVGAYSDADAASWTPALMAATGYDPAAAGDEGLFWLPLRAWLQRFDRADAVPRVRLGEGGWCQVVAPGQFTAMPTPVDNGESAAGAPQYLLALGAPGSVHINVRQDVQGGEVPAFAFNLLVQRREAGEDLAQPVEASLSASCALSLTMARGEITCVLELEAGGAGYAIIPFLEEPTPSAGGFTVNVASRAPFTLRAAQPGAGGGSQLLPACT